MTPTADGGDDGDSGVEVDVARAADVTELPGDGLRDALWARHANPASGATRLPLTPVIAYALYHRRWRLLGLALLWTAVNPVAFPPPERTDNWFSEGVLGEKLWLDDGNPVFRLRYPSVLNLLDVPAFVTALYAAWTQRPRATVLATAASMALKLAFVDAMARYYRSATSSG